MGDPLARKADQFVGGDVRPRLFDHRGLDRLAPCLVRDADHRHVGNRRMAEQGAFDLCRIDVLAAGNDHVLHAVVNIDVAVGVEVTGVAGMKPFAADGASRCFRLVPVAEHILRRSRNDLAHLADGDIFAGGIDDADFDSSHRLAA